MKFIVKRSSECDDEVPPCEGCVKETIPVTNSKWRDKETVFTKEFASLEEMLEFVGDNLPAVNGGASLETFVS